MSIGYLSQIYSDNESVTVRQEIKNGFKDIIEAEKELTIIEEKMAQDPENMEIIEHYTTTLERFNNI
jgi:ATPase subunit of ABC transporter with duplicated ATPase domains